LRRDIFIDGLKRFCHFAMDITFYRPLVRLSALCEDISAVCVMATVPASALVRTIMANQEDPRMPAILEDSDWEIWLGQNEATPEQAKSVLKTMERVNWKIAPEPKKSKPTEPN
jgi:hypothetical protein